MSSQLVPQPSTAGPLAKPKRSEVETDVCAVHLRAAPGKTAELTGSWPGLSAGLSKEPTKSGFEAAPELQIQPRMRREVSKKVPRGNLYAPPTCAGPACRQDTRRSSVSRQSSALPCPARRRCPGWRSRESSDRPRDERKVAAERQRRNGKLLHVLPQHSRLHEWARHHRNSKVHVKAAGWTACSPMIQPQHSGAYTGLVCIINQCAERRRRVCPHLNLQRPRALCFGSDSHLECSGRAIGHLIAIEARVDGDVVCIASGVGAVHEAVPRRPHTLPLRADQRSGTLRDGAAATRDDVLPSPRNAVQV